MTSTLEKKVIRKIEAAKKAAAEKAEQERKEAAAFQAKLPDRCERARIVYPSITDGNWKYYFDCGHWRLRFWVQDVVFEIRDEYIPADPGTPTEGYAGTDAHYEKYLFVVPPNDYGHSLGYVGDVEDKWLVARSDKGKGAAKYKQWIDEKIKEINGRIAYLVEDYLTHVDTYRDRWARGF